ncbi:MAG: urease subunit beta [Nitrospirota bacterium]|nr:urease subunit beta [Nitrospirota bacterium]
MKKPTKNVKVKAKSSAKLQAKADGLVPSRKAPQPTDVIPGEIILGKGDIVALEGRPTVGLTVANVGDRPIQVGSHCHFFEANRSLTFDREKAYGFRLLIPAGTAVRFEPGEEKRVTLVALGGNRVAYGINGLTHGRLDDPRVKTQALARAAERGFLQKRARP